ncbi:MAG: DUF1801 domain-containing protein [Candidatus Eremiobacteraeota bacterium]|nr:DUF1801 domain-containing protein [Candidatus Eremiobacteraeota bacterium]
MPATVNQYMRALPRNVRACLEAVRHTIRSAVPEAEETMSYGMPSFVLGGKKLVWFGAFKSHVGFYPGAAAVAAFEKELSAYNTAKGSVRFPYGEPLPLELVDRIVRYRVRHRAD